MSPVAGVADVSVPLIAPVSPAMVSLGVVVSAGGGVVVSAAGGGVAVSAAGGAVSSASCLLQPEARSAEATKTAAATGAMRKDSSGFMTLSCARAFGVRVDGTFLVI